MSASSQRDDWDAPVSRRARAHAPDRDAATERAAERESAHRRWQKMYFGAFHGDADAYEFVTDQQVLALIDGPRAITVDDALGACLPFQAAPRPFDTDQTNGYYYDPKHRAQIEAELRGERAPRPHRRHPDDLPWFWRDSPFTVRPQVPAPPPVPTPQQAPKADKGRAALLAERARYLAMQEAGDPAFSSVATQKKLRALMARLAGGGTRM
jgi:hypothetical protein